jgi:CxC6 like cysteine cluster associated with KDZ transposases
MTGEHVYDAFFLRALIKYHMSAGSPLVMSNSGVSQAERLRPLLIARNAIFQGPGRPDWDHCCDSCSIKTYSATSPEHPNGEAQYPPILMCLILSLGWIRSMVTDGVTLGHPCCAIHECKNPLQSHRMRYCLIHSNKEAECSILNCSNPAQTGFKTCTSPTCRGLEDHYDERKTAMFQLKRRLLFAKEPLHPVTTTLRPSHSSAANFEVGQREANELLEDDSAPVDSIEAAYFSDDELLVPDIVTVPAPNQHFEHYPQPTKQRSQFGRRRTHNEQLCVGSCGIVIGRTTFFGSEGMENVLVCAKIHVYSLSLMPTSTGFLEAALPDATIDAELHVVR